MAARVRVWLAERTYSDDEQNLIVLTYATPDGRREYRKERALPSFSGPGRETPVSLEVAEDNLASVGDESTRHRYEAAVARIRDRHDPDDTI